jgi:hypothetical protein
MMPAGAAAEAFAESDLALGETKIRNRLHASFLMLERRSSAGYPGD